MKTLQKDALRVEIFENRTQMGMKAAADIAACFKKLLETKDEIYVIFAAAPSQNDVLASLVEDPTIDWSRINARHMDEYVGLPKDAPQRFGNFLSDHIFGKVPFRTVSYLDPTSDPEAECRRYAALLDEHPVDVVVMGIGENGHIAFNDPGVADFHDKQAVKVVPLDPVCRKQQVNDGCFASLDDVPTHALTLTVPALVRAPHLFCIVPAATKANAVLETLTGEIGEHCPATVLRTQEGAVLYLDEKSSALLPETL